MRFPVRALLVLSLLAPAVLSGAACSPEDAFRVRGDRRAQVGDAVALVASFAGATSYDRSYSWRQVGGPPVELITAHTSVLAFDAPEAGRYSFEVDATIDGELHTASATLDVSDLEAEQARARVRLDRGVRSGQRVSLRVQPPAGETLVDVVWRQVSGPTAPVSVPGSIRVGFVDVPVVSRDRLLRYEVEVWTLESGVVKDDVYLYATPAPPYPEENAARAFRKRLVRMFPYREDSPHADELLSCIYENTPLLPEGCRDALPFLGADGQAPTIDDVLDRVIVSHPWMGVRFEEFLRRSIATDDFLQMFGSVRAIAIAADVRPSFYYSRTAAIYLSPDYLWSTPAERDTIDEAPDYRSGFGSDLSFFFLSRSVIGDEYATNYISRSRRDERSADQVERALARLLYHELAHAVDYFPAEVLARATGAARWDDLETRFDASELPSDVLEQQLPLTSEQMDQIGKVMFRGEDTPEEILAASPEQVASWYVGDRAPDVYAYTTRREDLAMLFQNAMMSDRYGIERDEAVTTRPENPTSDNVILAWGQRGRVGDPAVRPRAQFVVERMLPGLDAAALVDALPEPRPLEVGRSWSDSRFLGEDPPALAPAVAGDDASPVPLAAERSDLRDFE